MTDLTTRFNHIAIQSKDPDGKWTRKPLAYLVSNDYSSVRNTPIYLFNFVFQLIHAATQSVGNVFLSFVVLFENQYFLICNLHCSWTSFTNVTSLPLVLLFSFIK